MGTLGDDTRRTGIGMTSARTRARNGTAIAHLKPGPTSVHDA